MFVQCLPQRMRRPRWPGVNWSTWRVFDVDMGAFYGVLSTGGRLMSTWVLSTGCFLREGV
jgi:hypothetical protein